MPNHDFIFLPEALYLIGCSLPTLNKLIRKGQFPEGRMHLNRRVWDRREVQRALARMAGISAT